MLVLLHQLLTLWIEEGKRHQFDLRSAVASLQAGQAQILAIQLALLEKVNTMSQTMSEIDTDLSNLSDEVTSNGDVVQSAVTLIGGFAGQLATIQAELAAAGVQPAQLAKLVSLKDTLMSQKTALAEAVAANTTAAPPSDPATPAPAPVSISDGTSTSTEGSAAADTTA